MLFPVQTMTDKAYQLPPNGFLKEIPGRKSSLKTGAISFDICTGYNDHDI